MRGEGNARHVLRRGGFSNNVGAVNRVFLGPVAAAAAGPDGSGVVRWPTWRRWGKATIFKKKFPPIPILCVVVALKKEARLPSDEGSLRAKEMPRLERARGGPPEWKVDARGDVTSGRLPTAGLGWCYGRRPAGGIERGRVLLPPLLLLLLLRVGALFWGQWEVGVGLGF